MPRCLDLVGWLVLLNSLNHDAADTNTKDWDIGGRWPSDCKSDPGLVSSDTYSIGVQSELKSDR